MMAQEGLSRCSKCRRYCRLVTTFLFSHIGLCGLVVGYSLVGAFTFEALEAGYEQTKREAMVKEREGVVTDLWSLTAKSSVLSEQNWTALATETLQEFEVILVKAVRKEGYDGKDESPLQWTFSGALLYSIIVITTIGYGNVAPKTPWGKVITIVYAIIGIPLLLLCLSNIGDAMAHSFKFIYWKVCCYFCIRPKKRKKKSSHRLIGDPYRMTVLRPTAPAPSSDLSRHSPLPPDTPSTPPTPSSHSTTFHTAPSSALSSSKSTPCHEPPPPFDSALFTKGVIPNRYALQQEEGGAKKAACRKVGTVVCPRPEVFTVTESYGNGTRMYAAHNSLPWPHTVPGRRSPIMDDDDDCPSDEDESSSSSVSVPMWLCSALVLAYICGGAVLFTFWERWDFLDSSYFCFVTLTTIGFGDLVPGSAVMADDAQVTLGLCSLYLLFGMALLAMSFNLVQEEVTRSVRCIGKRIGIVSDDDEDD